MEQALGARLLAARDRKQAVHEEVREIPGYDGQLWARYRPVEYRRAFAIVAEHEKLTDGAEKLLRTSADTLVAACTGCEARIDEETHPLPPLGLELCKEIGLEGGDNDRQAVLAIFPSEFAVVQQAGEVQDLSTLVNQRIDRSLEENSSAASLASS